MNSISQTAALGSVIGLSKNSARPGKSVDTSAHIRGLGRFENLTRLIGRAVLWFKEWKDAFIQTDISFDPLIDFPRDI